MYNIYHNITNEIMDRCIMIIAKRDVYIALKETVAMVLHWSENIYI